MRLLSLSQSVDLILTLALILTVDGSQGGADLERISRQTESVFCFLVDLECRRMNGSWEMLKIDQLRYDMCPYGVDTSWLNMTSRKLNRIQSSSVTVCLALLVLVSPA